MDGGLLNNLPVDVVKAMGADVVIAIDLQQKQHKDREFSLKSLFGIDGPLNWLVERPDWKNITPTAGRLTFIFIRCSTAMVRAISTRPTSGR